MTTAPYSYRPHHLDLVDQISRAIPTDYAHSRLLLAIAQFCRCDGGVWKAWPSIDTLRQACGYKDSRNVRLLLDQLQKLGLISVYRRHRASNLYVLHPSRIEAFDPVRAGLRKVKDRATSSIKALMKAVKEFLHRKKTRTKDGIFIDHNEAERVATAEAKAIAAKDKLAAAQAAKAKRAQAGGNHYSGPSRRALELIADSISWQLEQATKKGDTAEIARLKAQLQDMKL